MFDYTRSVFTKTLNDLKKLAFLFAIGLQVLQIGYLVYALIIGSGVLAANIVLLAISTAYLVFIIYIHRNTVKKEMKKLLKNIYRWSKRAIKLFTLGVSIYGLYVTASDPITVKSLLSIVLLIFMLLTWVFDVLLSLVILLIEQRKNMFFDAMKMDFEPVFKAKNFFDKVRGREVEDELVSTKMRTKLDFLRDEFRKERTQAKLTKKAERKAERAAKKAEKKGKGEILELPANTEDSESSIWKH